MSHFLAIVSLVSLLYILYIIISGNLRKKSRLKHFEGTVAVRDSIVTDFDKQTKSRLFGFDPSNALLVWSNIVLSLFAVLTFADSKSRDRLVYRPYIGLERNVMMSTDAVVADTPVYPHTNNSFSNTKSIATRITLYIKNYGVIPTMVAYSLEGWHGGEVKEFQNPENYIMPGQVISLSWNLNIDQDGTTTPVCNLYKDVSIKLNYSGYSTEIHTRFEDDPRNNPSTYIFDMSLGCNGQKELVPFWYVNKAS